MDDHATTRVTIHALRAARASIVPCDLRGSQGPFAHPPPPLVTNATECTRRWQRPVYAPTLILPLPSEAPSIARPLLPAIKAPPPRRPTLPPSVAPAPRLSIAVESPITERQWRARTMPEHEPLPDITASTGVWSWVFMALVSGTLGAASWLAVAHLGVI